MSKEYRTIFYYVLPLLLFAIWVDLPSDPVKIGSQQITTHLGLDLVGGVQVLLEADLPDDVDVKSESMDIALQTIEGRVNGLLG
ncbi:MAG: protein translocase subunit SecD, partial [Chloroflexota bacterium]